MAGTGAPEPHERRLSATVVLGACIGCGALERSAPCTGACDDRRFEVVDEEHSAALAAWAARASARAGALLTALRAIDREGDAAEIWRAARDEVRDALRAGGDGGWLPEAPVVVAWRCATCGRIEAPQPCVGICVRRPRPFLTADEHAATQEQAEAAASRLAMLEPLARQLAWSTPRPGAEERALRALRSRVAAAAAAVPG